MGNCSTSLIRVFASEFSVFFECFVNQPFLGLYCSQPSDALTTTVVCLHYLFVLKMLVYILLISTLGAVDSARRSADKIVGFR